MRAIHWLLLLAVVSGCLGPRATLARSQVEGVGPGQEGKKCIRLVDGRGSPVLDASVHVLSEQNWSRLGGTLTGPQRVLDDPPQAPLHDATGRRPRLDPDGWFCFLPTATWALVHIRVGDRGYVAIVVDEAAPDALDLVVR